MTLLQQTLERIERDATKETRSAMRFADLIDECEQITRRLNDAAGESKFMALVTTYSHVEGVDVRAYATFANLDDVRSEIAAAGQTIGSVQEDAATGRVLITLEGVSTYVDIGHTVAHTIAAAA